MDFFKDVKPNKPPQDSDNIEPKQPPKPQGVFDGVVNRSQKKKSVKQPPSIKVESIPTSKPQPRKPEPKTPSPRSQRSGNQRDELSDMYESEDWRREMEDESESLKQLLAYDTLRIYGRIRTIFARLSAVLRQGISQLKRVRYSKKIALSMGAAVLVGLVGLGLYNSVINSTPQEEVVGEASEAEVLSEAIEPVDPAFETVKPKGADDVEPQGITGDGQVATYQDQIGSTTIIVSQQPLPQKVRDEEFGMQSLAESLNGTESVSSFDLANQNIYLIEQSNGSQIAMFNVESNLIFIRASKAINESAWADYITNLE